VDWAAEVVSQLDFHWNAQLRPRLDGLTDEEYLWEPVPGAWSIRDGVIDWAWPAPDPAPVTTIAWRLAHIVIGCFSIRSATHFGAPAVSYDDFPYAGTAEAALAQLDEAYATWLAGVRSLGVEGMARPSGEPGFGDLPMATLVLHINREVIHHGAELALLRDLYLRRS
jgi:hypothetical protein